MKKVLCNAAIYLIAAVVCAATFLAIEVQQNGGGLVCYSGEEPPALCRYMLRMK